MKTLFSLLLLILFQQNLYAQPVVPGTTTFGVTPSGAPIDSGTPTPSGSTHGFTASVLTNASGVNCQMFLAASAPLASGAGDQVLNFTDGGALSSTMTELSLKSDDGSEFKLNTIHFGMQSATNQTVTMTGYKDNSVVTLATATINVTLVANSFDMVVDVSANANFADIDEVRFSSDNVGANLWFFDDIVLATAIPQCSFDSNDGGTITNANFSGSSTNVNIGTGSGFDMGQSFQACGSGILSSVDVLMIDANSNITIRVYSGAGNTGTLLGTVNGLTSTVAGDVGDRSSFNLSAANIAVVSGQTYTFYISSSDVTVNSRLANTAIYANGTLYNANTIIPQDFLFSINITATTIPPSCSITVSPPSEVTIYWKGCTDNDWGTASNWSTGVVPTVNDIIYVSANANNPLIIDEVATCAKMIVEIGGVCKVDYNAGGKLVVKF